MIEFFKYFQLSVLVLFTVLLVARLLYLRLRKGINAVSIISNKGTQRMLGIAVVTIINLWVVVLLIHVIQPEIHFLPEPLDIHLVSSLSAGIAGVILIVLGLVLYISAWVILSNTWRIGQDEQRQEKLVTSGVYKISRNPMYLFYALYLAGTFFINGALVFLILAIVLAITLHYLVLEEEKSLTETYGRSYHAYITVTSRYFTWRALHR